MDPRNEFGPGLYVIREVDDDLVAWGYWHAYLGEVRVNGGVCEDYTDGVERSLQAIARAREQMLRERFYWDAETCLWIRKGSLPPVS
jgi:hypothetical protein